MSLFAAGTTFHRAFACPAVYRVWHDRAVFHFLVRSEDRRAYVKGLDAALAGDGRVIIATFALDGPVKCSGLPVARFDAPALMEELGPNYALVEERHEQHITPAGRAQSFVYCRFRRVRLVRD